MKKAHVLIAFLLMFSTESCTNAQSTKAEAQTFENATIVDNYDLIISGAEGKVAYQKHGQELVVIDTMGTIQSLIQQVLNCKQEAGKAAEIAGSAMDILKYVKTDGSGITDLEKFSEAIKNYNDKFKSKEPDKKEAKEKRQLN